MCLWFVRDHTKILQSCTAQALNRGDGLDAGYALLGYIPREDEILIRSDAMVLQKELLHLLSKISFFNEYHSSKIYMMKDKTENENKIIMMNKSLHFLQ